MTGKKKIRVIKVPRSVLHEFKKLQQQNELLEERNSHLVESIAALRDVIQTFQGRANLEGAIHKTDLQSLIKALKHDQ